MFHTSERSHFTFELKSIPNKIIPIFPSQCIFLIYLHFVCWNAFVVCEWDNVCIRFFSFFYCNRFNITKTGNSEQQILYETYCRDDDNDNTTLTKVDKMQQMCMCGFLRDAILPQTELHSILQSASKSITAPIVECINSKAKTVDQTYPCENISLISFLNLQDISAAYTNVTSPSTSSIWGWYDHLGNEIALIGTFLGLAFVDITIPNNPNYLGTLQPPSNGRNSFWRDVRVYKNYVYSVTEHGRMQYLDMNTLLNLRDTNMIPTNGLLLTPYAKEFGDTLLKTHTININEESGFAYLVGSNLCSGGLYIVNITIPSQPSYAGCFDSDGYTHEVQCTFNMLMIHVCYIFYR
jgi:hypothetical protein